MKRSTNIGWGNVRVGLLIVFGVGLMFWASLSGGGTSLFESKKSFKSYFKSVEGMVKGSPVWLAGLEVGNVRSISFVNLDSLRRIEIVCYVKDDIWPLLTENARVQIGTIGFLGDKYVEIVPGEKGGTPIPEGGIILAESAADASAVFEATHTAVQDAGQVVTNLDSLLSRMNRGEGTLGQLAQNDVLYKTLTEALVSMTKLTNALQKNQEHLMASVERTSKSLESVSAKLDQNTGTAGRLMNDPTLYDNLTSTTSKLDSLLAKLNRPDNTFGLLVNDTAAYVEVVNLIARMNNLVADIQEHPHRYLKLSVF